jgi:ADP-heptose:LPS heptosyltransferase
MPDVHIVDRYLATLHAFSVENDEKGLDFFIDPRDTVEIDKLLPEIQFPYVLVVVGGGHFTKQIPVHRLVEVIDQLNCTAVLLGGKEDAIKASAIHAACRNKPIDLTGKLTIGQSASLIQQSQLILTPDTGMMHIAAAFKKPILSLWGNTVPAFGMYPYLSDSISEIFEVNGLSCRPCSKIGYSKCPKKHFRCMEQQDYTGIVERINNYVIKERGNF